MTVSSKHQTQILCLFIAASLLALVGPVAAGAQEPVPGSYIIEPATRTAPWPYPPNASAASDGKPLLERAQDLGDEDMNLEPKALQVILDEDFEGAFPGPWNVFDDNGPIGGEVYWDDTSWRSYTGSWSAWCADGGTNASPPGGNYKNDMDSWMVFGPFSLADATSGSWSFRLWNQSEMDWDFIFWGVSLDGANFSGQNLSGNTGGWVSRTVDFTNVPGLGDITGAPSVWIGYEFQSDASVVYEGAYVDDVLIQKSTATPQICQPGPTTLCIGTRFRIRMTWSTTQGGGLGGTANAVPLSPLGINRGGILYFTDQGNPEVLIKVLNACVPPFNHYWVFYAATTNVGFTITVEDLVGGVTKFYSNPDRNAALTITDIQAFATCP